MKKLPKVVVLLFVLGLLASPVLAGGDDYPVTMAGDAVTLTTSPTPSGFLANLWLRLMLILY